MPLASYGSQHVGTLSVYDELKIVFGDHTSSDPLFRVNADGANFGHVVTFSAASTFAAPVALNSTLSAGTALGEAVRTEIDGATGNVVVGGTLATRSTVSLLDSSGTSRLAWNPETAALSMPGGSLVIGEGDTAGAARAALSSTGIDVGNGRFSASPTGATVVGGTLNVAGAASLASTLQVSGATTLGSASIGGGALNVAAGSNGAGVVGVVGEMTIERDSTTIAQFTASQTTLAKLAVEGETSVATLAASGAATLDSTLSVAGAATLSGGATIDGLTVAGTTLSGLSDPTAASHAANKHYVDSVAQGLHFKPAVRAASAAGESVVLDETPPATLDGVTLESGDRVLLKNQDDAAENGIYVFQSGLPLARAADFDNGAEDGVHGAFVFSMEGASNANTGWVCTNNSAVDIGVDAISFTQFSGAGSLTVSSDFRLEGNELHLEASLGATTALPSLHTIGDAPAADEPASEALVGLAEGDNTSSYMAGGLVLRSTAHRLKGTHGAGGRTSASYGSGPKWSPFLLFGSTDGGQDDIGSWRIGVCQESDGTETLANQSSARLHFQEFAPAGITVTILAGELLTATSNTGLEVGDPVVFDGAQIDGAGAAPLLSTQTYYIASLETNGNFKISETPGGAAIDFGASKSVSLSVYAWVTRKMLERN